MTQARGSLEAGLGSSPHTALACDYKPELTLDRLWENDTRLKASATGFESNSSPKCKSIEALIGIL